MISNEMLEKVLTEAAQEGVFPSAAAAVGIRDQVLAEAYVGEAPLPGQQKVNAHTLYDMASMTKILAPTMLALQAVDAGRLHLTDRIGDFFPEAPRDKRDITIFMLMTHTSGIVPHFRLDQRLSDPAQAVSAILAEPLAAAPGTAVNYTCMGFILLGKILEQCLGKNLDVLARERVFLPLGMLETGYCPDAEKICAATELNPGDGAPIIGVVHDENARFLGGVSGNAGVFMPLCDGERYAAFLACGCRGMLSQKLFEEAVQNYTPGLPGEEHRGLGFKLAGTPGCFFGTDVPPYTFGHCGFTGTSLIVEPKSGLWVLLLSNRVYPTRENIKILAFRRKLHSLCWKSMADEA